MIDCNIPELRRLCLCNCEQREKLDDLQKQSLAVWRAEISEIESHGYKKGSWDGLTRSAYRYADGSPVPEPDEMDKLCDIVSAARERAYEALDVLREQHAQLQLGFVLVDQWGVLIEDLEKELRELPVWDESRRRFRENLKNRRTAPKRPR